MSKRKSYAGSTSVSLPIFVQDTSSSTGAGLGSLVFSTAGLTAEYRRKGQSSWTAISLVTNTLGTYTSGGFIADGSLTGAYEFCPPDAAFASGVAWVAIRLYGATNMLPVLMEFELDAVNYQDGVHFGLTALPNAASATSGGLPTVGTSSGQINPSSGGVDVQSFKTHAVVLDANNYPGVNIMDVGGQPASLFTATAQAGSSNTITLASTASSTDSFYNEWVVQRLDTGEWAIITGYVGSTKVATIRGTWISGTNPTSSTNYILNTPVSADIEYILGTASQGAAGYVGTDQSKINSPGAIVNLSGTTIGTLTTYTGNTPQTGDSFARIGATGSGLTSLAPAATALSTVQWTNTRAGNLDNLDAAVSSRSTYAGGAVASVTAPVTVTMSQLLGSPRALDAIADSSIQLNDALWAAIGAGVGKADASGGTSEIIATPSTGTTLRTFTLTAVAGTPSSYITKRT